MNLPVTNVPGCIGSNAKTIGLQYLQFLDMGASGMDLVQKIPALYTRQDLTLPSNCTIGKGKGGEAISPPPNIVFT